MLTQRFTLRTFCGPNSLLKPLLFVSAFTALCLAVSACGWLNTREPEEPDAGSTSFIPPTSPDIVLLNFSAAIREKNAEKFAACFPEASLDEINPEKDKSYLFEPSAEAAQRFAGVFADWDVERERQAFVALMARVPETRIPALTLSAGLTQFETQSPDSSRYISDYVFVHGAAGESAPDTVAGTLSFTLQPADNGFWYIRRWTDLAEDASDATRETWSTLKAQFVN